MIAYALAAVCAGLVGVLAAMLSSVAPRDRLVRDRMRDIVIVTMKSGEAFHGVLYAVDGRSLILRDAKALTDASDRPVPVDGELVLDRAQVDYMQRPG